LQNLISLYFSYYNCPVVVCGVLKMDVHNTNCYMPLDMLDLIAAADAKAYRAMLAIPLFARSLSICKVVDFMIVFGYSVRITKNYIEWLLNGEPHRVDGPAMKYTDGNSHWYLNGKRHRDDGPAIERANGHKEWWKDGKLHRIGGPAVEHANGNKGWLLNGNLHRDDGPAMEFASGSKVWYLNGIRQQDQ
jgi:hypothetical protein